MAIMNLLNLPLLFASNALFPAKFMPSWLQPIVRINPISYATDVATPTSSRRSGNGQPDIRLHVSYSLRRLSFCARHVHAMEIPDKVKPERIYRQNCYGDFTFSLTLGTIPHPDLVTDVLYHET